MRQISFQHFYPLAFLPPDCAPSATKTVEVSAVAAPASSGSGACSSIARRGHPLLLVVVSEVASCAASLPMQTQAVLLQTPAIGQVPEKAGSSVDGIEVTELFELAAPSDALSDRFSRAAFDLHARHGGHFSRGAFLLLSMSNLAWLDSPSDRVAEYGRLLSFAQDAISFGCGVH